MLEVESGPYFDDTPMWGNPDLYTIRFKVKPIVILDLEQAVPIKEQRVWQSLTITRNLEQGHSQWTGHFRSPLNTLENDDGHFLGKLLKEQQLKPVLYPLTERDKRQLAQNKKIRTLEREVEVEVPEIEDDEPSYESEVDIHDSDSDVRESTLYQAKVARIGAAMGFYIWVPRNNKVRVLEHVPSTMHVRFLVLQRRVHGGMPADDLPAARRFS